eukprot:CAMPEP_0204392418 /NCGR_PEP_ID=MMETSP0469-20131031/61749_1 /ASSEMBLY_ACC=CAM_ASM_000384 /TAXON_ID=2969 /ORGANISM="Oxyrrhis marina" /LENGTH=295 /DNA_ID=CAMNT_0051386395 /DNA_START=23 /DNA_END=910 /DNA_ORIENTATION=+
MCDIAYHQLASHFVDSFTVDEGFDSENCKEAIINAICGMRGQDPDREIQSAVSQLDLVDGADVNFLALTISDLVASSVPRVAQEIQVKCIGRCLSVTAPHECSAGWLLQRLYIEHRLIGTLTQLGGRLFDTDPIRSSSIEFHAWEGCRFLRCPPADFVQCLPRLRNFGSLGDSWMSISGDRKTASASFCKGSGNALAEIALPHYGIVEMDIDMPDSRGFKHFIYLRNAGDSLVAAVDACDRGRYHISVDATGGSRLTVTSCRQSQTAFKPDNGEMGCYLGVYVYGVQSDVRLLTR